MSQIIDKRHNANKKSTVNRRRFLRRYQNQIKQAVNQAIGKRKITEIEQGESIIIPTKDLSEPHFSHGKGGERRIVLPGNDSFSPGDSIDRPQTSESQGSGGDASNQGEGEDNFIFQLSQEEFLEFFFEDLALPDLVKKDLARVYTSQTIRSGVIASGTPNNINVPRSMRHATGRRIALRAAYKKRIALLEQELKEISETKALQKKRQAILDAIEKLEKQCKSVAFIDTIDLRYNNKIKIYKPSTQAVMFCIMDVSGSMDEEKKDIAKRFFILLYLFLKKNYQKIELVFIRHHTSAKAVDEHDFFYSRETGGTVVSSALELLTEQIQHRFNPQAWNIYVAQASDGDNWNADSPYCLELMQKKIMALVQYFAYVEIKPRHHQSLWNAYQNLQEKHKNFAMENINEVQEIYPVFRELFKRSTS